MILYLETSRLVKLYVEESGSDETASLLEKAEFAATSIISYVEARAALARKTRDGGLTEDGHKMAKASLEADWERFIVLHTGMDVVREAARLAEKHGLRGFDALHLASALSFGSGAEGKFSVIFASADVKLKEAARIEGLTTA
jgi:predicted nucleic acid-binding protein